MRCSTTTWRTPSTLGERVVEHRLHRHGLAAAPAAVGGDHRLRAAVAQSSRQRLRPETREQRHQDRAELQHREERDIGLGQVRHVQADDVAAAEAERAQPAGEAADLGIEFAIAETALLGRVLAFPDQEGLFPDRAAAMAVEAIQHDVGGAADAPARPLDAVRGVEQLPVRGVEAQVAELEHLLHQPGRVGVRTLEQARVVGRADPAQERAQVAVLDDLRARLPREAPRVRATIDRHVHRQRPLVARLHSAGDARTRATAATRMSGRIDAAAAGAASRRSLRGQAAVIGAGISPVGRVPGRSPLWLAADAARHALADAGIAKTEVDGVLASAAFASPFHRFSVAFSEYLGIQPTFSNTLQVSGATAATLFNVARRGDRRRFGRDGAGGRRRQPAERADARARSACDDREPRPAVRDAVRHPGRQHLRDDGTAPHARVRHDARAAGAGRGAAARARARARPARR